MAEIRGSDLVVEYLIKEKVPYLFGYAGHGAVGLLDGVYNHQDELKIIFPRIESAAGYMADAYFRASGKLIPRLHLHRPRADAADRRHGQRLLRLVGVHRDHRAGGYEPVRLRRAPGGVPPLPGRLPEHREGGLEAQLPGPERRGPRQVPAQGLQARPHRPARPRPHRRPVRPLDPYGRRRGAGTGGALAQPRVAHAPARRGRRPRAFRC